MSNANKPPKWTNVYPQGSKEGDEESKFFIALGRNPKFKWRSVSAIAKETGLSQKRVEEIVAKYYTNGMVLQNPKNEDQWGYWERVGVDGTDDSTIAQTDQKKRVKRAMGDADDIEEDDDDDAVCVAADLFDDDEEDDDDCCGSGSCGP